MRTPALGRSQALEELIFRLASAALDRDLAAETVRIG
jgi:hypothetical protein